MYIEWSNTELLVSVQSVYLKYDCLMRITPFPSIMKPVPNVIMYIEP